MVGVLRYLVCILALVAGANRLGAADTTIFAAASLRGPLDRAVQDFPGSVRISYGGSGGMARQIALGAPADAVFLANAQWMDWLQDQGIDLVDRQDLLSNQLVVIAPADERPIEEFSEQSVLTRLQDSRLAMGNHRTVPAGIYAAQWLETAGLWQILRTRLAETENVAVAARLVARQETPLGIVYATDAQDYAPVTVVHSIPPSAHDPIRYPVAALTPRGQALVQHLAQRLPVFYAAGFLPVEVGQ